MTAQLESSVQTARQRLSPFGVLKAYVALTKPRIIETLLVSTVPSMLLAAHGMPSLWLIVATVTGGTLAAGSANALNCYIDRDIDEVMSRTQRRPLARHTVEPRNALIFGLLLGVAAVGFLWWQTNALAALLALAAILFYVLVYTAVLKRRTSQNIVWGGAAGCMPVLIGWAAVTNSLAWAPLVLFGIIFFWTPPHYWPLAMKFRDDYAKAGVPMLPVVASARVVTGQILAYSWAMVICSLLLWPLATSWVYGVTALVLGGWFLVEAHRLNRQVRRELKAKPMRLFHLSITYLTVLFVAVAVDALIS